MAKKFIDVMDTTFRDGFQSVYGARVLMNDFLPALEAAKEAGIEHFEFGGGARFQSLYFYLNEDAFAMMDKFRSIVGPKANLQTLSRGVNTVTLDTGSRELIDLHAKLFKKHGTTTIRNFDALNDVENLKYSGERIAHHGLKHEVVVTMMDLPSGCVGAHDVKFYEKILREILDANIPYHSVCFKDASGTSSPQKVYETIKMARKLLPEKTHIRLHTHETAGVSVACYLAALEAGVDGIDLAASPVSGGTSQPDILTMLHAVKGKNYDLGGLDVEKILKYESVLNDCLKEYFLPPEAVQVSPLIPFSPMPGGALTANTQMMRDNNILDKFPEVILAMREVVQKGGYGTSVTPVSQFYFQQAFNNVMFGKWKKIAEGYGKMVLGYFGKTPVTPDKEIIKLASEQLGLKPTTKHAVDIADKDESKSLAHVKEILKQNKIKVTEENVFIAAACKEKGIAFLKGEAKVNVRKIDPNAKANEGRQTQSGRYSVVVNGSRYNVEVSEGFNDSIQVKSITEVEGKSVKSAKSAAAGATENDIVASLPGAVHKILVSAGDHVKKGQAIVVLEAMKMEIEVKAPKDGIIGSIEVSKGQSVANNQVVAKFK
ncbi:biotin/lipoyl-containing protein [Campylobacter concisus]|uniref:biotin/lipoyl-containing protein n=1 Tax=Campylobacter concisus TaxID=199 RepID=UPI000CD9A75C|nr:biotin/lipoyl-containing protein [Campylobacter concisus]MBE9835546.1 biotin/lipoyl-binding protein [Campylobacter concisus]MBE9855964.1 biotin/lipoyl-binding protein [Campylobacter concisus]MBF0901522.1 biotin/lipoyl-binding protein [Campylobacter concisus]MBS6286022.1 biotin/lipoyl-binding protein [Campylobacter concisus]